MESRNHSGFSKMDGASSSGSLWEDRDSRFFFDLAFPQSDQKNFRRLGKSSHGQFQVSGLHFVQVSISSLSTLDSIVKPCDKTILWNKTVSFVWCYWCCLVAIRFGVLFTVSGLGISFCISFCVWILFCLDITIGCGHIYVKVGAKDKAAPIIAIPNVFGLFKPCTDNDSLHRKRLGMLGYED